MSADWAEPIVLVPQPYGATRYLREFLHLPETVSAFRRRGGTDPMGTRDAGHGLRTPRLAANPLIGLPCVFPLFA